MPYSSSSVSIKYLFLLEKYFISIIKKTSESRLLSHPSLCHFFLFIKKLLMLTLLQVSSPLPLPPPFAYLHPPPHPHPLAFTKLFCLIFTSLHC